MNRLAVLRKLIDVPVKLKFYVGEGAGAVSGKDIFIYIGKIKEILDECWLYFEHQPVEMVRQQISGEYLYLEHIWIWSICPLHDYDNSITVECIHCKEKFNLRDTKNTEYM